MGSCYSHWIGSTSPTHIGNAHVNRSANHTQQQYQQRQYTSSPSATEGEPAEGAEADKRPARERISACKRSADSGFRSRPGTSTDACSSSPDLHSQDREADSDLLHNSSGPDGTMTIDNRSPIASLPPRKVEKLSLAAEGMAYCQSLDGDCSPCNSSSTSPQDGISNGSGTFDFPSLTTSGVAQYAKRRLSVEGLPTPGSTDATYACALRLKHIVRLVERNRITKNVLLDNLEYAIQVVEKTYLEETRRLRDEDEDLSEAACSEVPDEVRDWLSATFKRNAGTGNLNATKPHFRSVANAIRAGIVVDRIYRRMSSCSNITLPPNLMLMLKGGLDDWNFDVFEFNEVSENHALKYVGFELLHKYNLISKFQLDTSRLENLLLRLEIGYSKYKNPYHNLVHAADVAQTCHVVMTMSRLRDYLTDLDVFAVVYAALIHDFEHTGTTNNFHVQTQTELALLYNDRNVLESYHVSAVFRITKEAEFNIFEKMPKEQYQEFRASVIEMVLNTDMSLHFSQVKTMKNLIAIPEIIDKLKALSLLVHCADIAHPCKDWKLHKHWSEILSEEFFRQGDREKELGMTISPLCDRTTVVLPQSQIGFIDFIVEPIFVVLGDMLDKMMETAPSRPASAAAQVDRKDESESEDENTPKSSDESRFVVPRPWDFFLKDNKEHWAQESSKLEAKKQEGQGDSKDTQDKPPSPPNADDTDVEDEEVGEDP
ncbi:Calcium/calmodulin-dependent 3',5'-cyclic nucleotide phosphodiesterase 1C [Sparganum proliferum]